MLSMRLLRRRKSHCRQLARATTANLKRRFLIAFGWLLMLALLHVVAMMWFESMGVGDAIWLTMTTLLTVGYGDLSATTLWGRGATILLLYLVGITLLAKLAGDYIDYRLQRRQDMVRGRRRWQLQQHLLIINSPDHNPEVYFKRLLRQLRASRKFADAPILLLTDDFPDGLPQSLREQGMVHYHGEITDHACLQAVDPQDAKAILLLAQNEHSRLSDSVTVDVLLQLQQFDSLPPVVAELVHEENRARALAAGANAMLRPIRGYPEILVQSLITPGSEQLLENLFTLDADHTRRYDIAVDHLSWADAVCRLVCAGIGTLVAYVAANGEVVCQPPHDETFKASALLVIVKSVHGEVPSQHQLMACLSKQ